MRNIRKKILEAVGKLILDQKKADFRMEDLAETAGITKKTIYNHFNGREELMQTAAREKIRELSEEMEKLASDETLSFTRRLDRIFDFATREYSALFPPLNTRKKLDEFFSVYIPIIQAENMKLVQHVIRIGIQSGRLRNDIDPDTLSVMFLNTVQSWGRLKDYGIEKTMDEFFDFTRKILLEGALTPLGRGEK